MSLKTHIGTKSSIYQELITEEVLSRFCKAIGAKLGDGMPPTFLTLFRKGEFELFQKLGIPLASVLHAEQNYQFKKSVSAGERVTYETILTDVTEKKSPKGTMHFLTLVTEVSVGEQKEHTDIGVAKSIIAVKS